MCPTVDPLARGGRGDITGNAIYQAKARHQCGDFQWSELAHVPHGPFGALSGSENLLHANSFLNSLVRPPLMTATSCCFAADLSFPTDAGMTFRTLTAPMLTSKLTLSRVPGGRNPICCE